MVTHYQRLLNYIVPDFVHVLVDGRIVRPAARNWRWSWKRRATARSKPDAGAGVRQLAGQADGKRRSVSTAASSDSDCTAL